MINGLVFILLFYLNKEIDQNSRADKNKKIVKIKIHLKKIL